MGTSLTVHSQIEFPVRKFHSLKSSPISLIGWCVRSDGETPECFLIRIGKRTLEVPPVPRYAPVSLPADLSPKQALFGLETTFKTGKGLKWIQIEARWQDGTTSKVGQRLIHVAKRGLASDNQTAFQAQFTRFWKHHQKLFAPLTLPERREFNQLPAETVDFILPIYSTTTSEQIQRSLDSLLRQNGGQWTLTLAVSVGQANSLEIAEQFAAKESRVRVAATQASLADCYNQALQECSHNWIAILEPGDTLAPEALQWVRIFQHRHPEVDVWFSDEDTQGRNEEPENPLLKPAHSPHLLEELPYWGQLTLYRRTRLLQVNGWNATFAEASTWELQLRLQSEGASIRHLPKVLYHRLPVREGGVSSIVPESVARAMLRQYFKTETTGLQPVAKGIQGSFSIRYPVTSSSGLVSIIIPFRDKPELLSVAVDAILRLTRYPAYEIILVDNDSKEEETLQLLKKLSNNPRIRVSPCRREFNFSALINHGAAAAKGEFLLFLNNDTQVITPDWLETMTGYAKRPEIGAVGALLFFEDGTLQHAGAVMGLTGLAGHAWSGLKPEEVPGGWAWHTRDVSVVTAACLMVRKKLFEEIGGFQEKFTVCGNDVDFCLRLHEAGYNNVVPSMVRLFHFESKSRDPGKIPPGDFAVSLERYAPWLDKGDPYWHPSLSLFRVTGLPRLTDERPIHLEHLRSVPGGANFQFPSDKEVSA